MWQKPDSGSYVDLRARLRQKMKQDGQVKEKILAAFNAVYEQTVKNEAIVLARSEKERLSRQLLDDILTELLNENKQSHG